MKTVDHLFHFSGKGGIETILREGFKPSYAKEKFGAREILVPMVSFSNILLRDVGKNEVLDYGDYGVGFTRQWGIENNLNPVNYTYDNGILDQSLNTFFFTSLFLSNLDQYKEYFKKWTQGYKKNPKGFPPFSKQISLTNTPSEVMGILDYLSLHYDDELADKIIQYSNSIRKTTLANIKLAKPYKVKNSNGKEFIAYNDREWRKIYEEISFLIGGSDDYNRWTKEPKPHFNDDRYRFKFSIQDVKVIIVAKEEEVDEIIQFLNGQYGDQIISPLLKSGSLKIGTRASLVNEGY